MKQTNITHNIRVDKNKSNRAVYEVLCGGDWPIISNRIKEYVPVNDFGMANGKQKER